MFQITIIVFREILEIALILSILFASTIGLKNRGKWILSGLALGILGSIVIAFFTDKISNSFEGMGQEIFSAIILFLASIMIGYTVIWMKSHSKNLNKELKELSKAVIDGEKSLYTIFIIVAISVLREGGEIVLFTYSYFLNGTSALELIFGSILGFILGLISGLAFYFGLVKTLGKYFFTVTTNILIFLSAGLMANSVGYLTDADIIPTIVDQLWDSSKLISDSGIIGNILHILVGYTSKPSAIQLIVYLISLFSLFFLIRKNNLKN